MLAFPLFQSYSKNFIAFFTAVLSIGWVVPVMSEDFDSTFTAEMSAGINIESDAQTTDNLRGVFTAFGNVKITYPQKDIVAFSREARYLKEEGLLILSGDVDLIRKNRDSLQGDRIVYLVEDDRIIADSDFGSQVFLTLLLEETQDKKEIQAR